ncbi:MAG: S24/S26 family peptidase [Candidatus Izemoplasmatales bacterium]
MKKVFDNQDFFKTINDTLLANKSVSFMVKGHSMSPFLKNEESEVFLKTKDNYQIYDICLFKYKDDYRLHRLIKVSNQNYYFRGDHLYQYEIVSKDHILAYVYQYQNHKLINVNRLSYKVKVRLFLLYKQVYMFLRRCYLVIKHG